MKNYIQPSPTPQLVFESSETNELEAKIKELDAEFKVREIEVTFKGDAYFFGEVRKSSDVADFIRTRIFRGIEVQEHFVAVYLNQAAKIIGYYHHSIGSINVTMVDVEIVASVALKTLAKSVIIAHNHPSGNLRPSEPDKAITKRIKQALKMFDINLLDHLILTRTDYYSFTDGGEGSILDGIAKTSDIEQKLREEILTQLKKTTAANSPNIYSIIQTAKGYAAIEQQIISKVLKDRMVPSAVIPLLESEMDMN